MRPIDADSLIPLFMEKANTMKDRHGVKLGEEWLLNYNDIKDVIDNAPTIVRSQGEWIKHIDNLYPEDSTEECPVCHEEQRLVGNDDNFCPNCGASMLKEAKNE